MPPELQGCCLLRAISARPGGTFLVKKRSGLYPASDGRGPGARSCPQAGAVLLTRDRAAVGLDAGAVAALAPVAAAAGRARPGQGRAGPGRRRLALGGDCLADIALLRAAAGGVRAGGLRPDGLPLIDTPRRGRAGRAGGDRRRPRRRARATAWAAGRRARPRPRHDAASRWSSTWTPPWSSPTPTRSTRRRPGRALRLPPAVGLRRPRAERHRRAAGRPAAARATPAPTPPPTTSTPPRRAGPAARHGRTRRGKKVLIRTDSAGGTHEFLAWLTRRPAVVLDRLHHPGDLTASRRRWPRSRSRRGHRPTTPTARSGPAPGSPRSPACST